MGICPSGSYPETTNSLRTSFEGGAVERRAQDRRAVEPRPRGAAGAGGHAARRARVDQLQVQGVAEGGGEAQDYCGQWSTEFRLFN